MPDALTDYGRVGAVALTDGLTPAQVAELLSTPPAVFVAARKTARRAVPSSEKMALSGLALLHARMATHGGGCALSVVRKGPLSADARSAAMVEIYRKLSGDVVTTDEALVSKALVLHRRRTTGGERPSPAMRRSFSKLGLAERQPLGHVYSDEVLSLEMKTNVPSRPVMSLRNCPDMDVRGHAVGDVFLVKGPKGEKSGQWFQARVRGFMVRCGLPPILIEYIATRDGDTDPEKLPNPKDSACRKAWIQPLGTPLAVLVQVV